MLQVLLEQASDGEDLLRYVERRLEPFGPFDKEKVSYPADSAAMIQALQDRMTQLSNNLERIWRASRFMIRINQKTGVATSGIINLSYLSFCSPKYDQGIVSKYQTKLSQFSLYRYEIWAII